MYLVMDQDAFGEVIGGLEDRLDFIVETLHKAGFNEFYIYETNQLLSECSLCLQAMRQEVGKGAKREELH